MFAADGIFSFPPAFVALCRYRNYGGATATVCSISCSRARFSFAEIYANSFSALSAREQRELCANMSGDVSPVCDMIQSFHVSPCPYFPNRKKGAAIVTPFFLCFLPYKDLDKMVEVFVIQPAAVVVYSDGRIVA